jgi:tetratricopeptide (TPR) repeat protein
MDRELNLQIALQGENLSANLIGPTGDVLAVSPEAQDVSVLNQITDPGKYARTLTDISLAAEIGEILESNSPIRIRLVVQNNTAKIQNLRWECLLKPSSGHMIPLSAGPATPFSRILHPDSKAYARSPQIDWPIRIIAAFSNPIDVEQYSLSPIDVEMEKAELQRSLRPLQGLVKMEIIQPPVSLDRICEALEKKPRIFHVMGHGAFSRKSGMAALFLEKEKDRTVHVVDQKEWIERLMTLAQTPQLVFLAACESAASSSEGVLTGLAPSIIDANAGAVVAMRDKVGMDTAREFIYHFYRRLTTHGEIDLAVNEARSYILDRGGWSWSIPVLFLERGAERIFALPPEALEAEPCRSGEILVLIPEFQGQQESFFEIDLRDRLSSQMAKAGLKKVRVVWLKKTVFGPGDDNAVRRLAARYEAALVIWGWFDKSRFSACFTVTESLFAYNDPTVFQADAGVRELLYSDREFAIFINQTLPLQVDFFVFFAVGQIFYWEGDYKRALTSLNQAVSAVENDAKEDLPDGLAYAYFYRGNLQAVHRQDRAAAIADYKKALAISPNFANAAFNLAEALRIRANTLRTESRKAQAFKSYQEAIDAYSQTIDIDPDYTKAYEGRGLTYFEIGENKKAEKDFHSASMQYPTAEIHHKQALALRNQGKLDEALKQIDKAIIRAPGTGYFYFSRGRIHIRMNDEVSAAIDFQTYLRLSPEDDAGRRTKVKHWLAERNVFTK